ncbi:hypothetical protein L5515_019223 [Caenorhabditis briggsae]|uniref:Uncharacterized protein n=1 Tax=Caenorhabditis briggsae TaxID=6238 RepID=A0AAE9FL88_CAEBR|nr:hypothetical protein L5515_019223 [Caenorhabditis briggsae]
MEKFQNLAQQFPRCQALPAPFLPKSRCGMSDGQEQLNGESSTFSRTNESGRRKCPRRAELLDKTEPPACRQQPKVFYRGAQGRHERSKKRK